MNNRKRYFTKLNNEHSRLLFLVVLLYLSLEAFFLNHFYDSNLQMEKQEAKIYGESVASSIRLSLDKSISASSTLKSLYLTYGEGMESQFQELAQSLADNDQTIGSMYLAPDGVIEMAYPAEVSASTIGFRMLEDPEQGPKAQKAIDTKYVTVAGPHKLVEGGTGFIVRNPVFENGEFKAFSVVVLDWEAFVKQVLQNLASEEKAYNFAVWVEHDSNIVTDEDGYIFKNCSKSLKRDLDVKIIVPNEIWHMTVEPINGYNPIGKMKFEIILSVILGIVLFITMYSRFISSERFMSSIEVDELTGLYNKQAFYQYTKKLLQKNPNTSYDVMVADIENFKLINSSYGENVGDEVLKYLAKAYSEDIRNGVCARIGGDMFVVISPSEEKHDEEQFKVFAKRITDNAPIANMVVKYGLYTNIDHELSPAIICDRAIAAMKSIKHNYNALFANYDGPVSTQMIKAQTFEARFEMALKNREFVAWYQPKYDPYTEKLVGAEALVRWSKTDGHMVSPGEFIPVFEQDGLIVKLDEYVFREVCGRVRRWMDEGKTMIPISVNLSRASLYHEGIVEKYRQIVEEYKVDPKYVPIELTESAMLNSREIKELAEKLCEAGFALYMDDFGAGYSSLASLNTLPFAMIKLDKSLVDYVTDENGKEIIRHTIETAHFLKMQVVAEGVETKEQLEILRTIDCDAIQGYYYSPPKPRKDFEKLLEVG